MTKPLSRNEAVRPGLRPVPEDLERVLRREGFRLAQWRVQPRRNRIVSQQGERPLDPRLIDVLVALACRPGEVLTRDELLSRVWSDTFVAENTLSQAVSRLRKALGDDPGRPRYIETISKSGYRLLAPVEWDVQPDAPRAVQTAEQGTEASSPTGVEPPKHDKARFGRPALYGLLALLVAVVSIAVGLGRRNTPARSPVAPESSVPRVRPELTLVGQQFGPRLSPDGRHIVFAWRGPEQTGSWDLWLKQVGGDNPVRLTDHEHDERLATWAPDGQAIAFVRFSETEGVCGIFRIPLLGGPADRLGNCMAGMRSLAWSPDGRALAFNGIPVDGAVRALFRQELTSGMRTRLTSPPETSLGDGGIAFSPDGRWIAFERDQGPFRHDVMVIPAIGGEPRGLTGDPWGQLRGVAWNSVGTSVLFSSNRAGYFQLWSVPVERGLPTRVPILDTWVTQPSVARSGGRMIYRTFRDSVDIWELSLDRDGDVAGEPVKRVPSSRSERHPAWSPGGDAIAFVSDRNGSHELWSGRPDGTQLRRHTDLTGPLPGSPAWSPDGQWLIYDAAVQGHSDLWRVARDGRQPQRLTDAASEERNGTFSADGRHVYFASNREGTWDVWSMPVEGGPAKRITRGGGFLAHESRDGQSLFYAQLDEPGIWRMPIDGGPAEQVLGDLDLSDWGSWVVAEHGIYYVRRGPTTLGYLGFDEAEPRVILTPPKQVPYLGRPLSLSVDGRSLLVSLIDHSDDEVMTVDLAGL